MERPSVRRGSVTALLLVIIASLGALLALELVWWNQLRAEADEAAEHLRLQHEALSVLAEVTNWLYTNKPGNPEDASPRPIELAASETPERLEIPFGDVCVPGRDDPLRRASERRSPAGGFRPGQSAGGI